MLIIALVLALIGLVALVFAVVTSNELVAWVCIGASVIGVVLLIVDALRERQRRDTVGEVQDVEEAGDAEEAAVDYPDEAADEEEHPAAEGGVDEASQGLETSDESAVPAEGRGEDRAT